MHNLYRSKTHSMPKLSASENKAVVVANNLAAGYKSKIIWENANFSVNPGEFVAILGPNGAGKTTLFRLLLGLAKPAKGALSVFGETPLRGNSKIGYIPQQHQIDEDSNIDAVEFVRIGIDGHKKEAAMDALKRVGAEDLTHRSLGALSGGELQRVFLAQALIGDPELLLLDEPLSSLDIKRESDFVQLINDVVRSRGVTVLFIAHNINPLLPVLDRVIYVANGRIASGKPHEVLTSESLSSLYGTPVEVLRDSRGRMAIIGTEEAPHHE